MTKTVPLPTPSSQPLDFPMLEQCTYFFLFSNRFSWNNIVPKSLDYKNAMFINEHGTSLSPWAKKRISHPKGWSMVLMANTYYNFTFENADHISNISYDSAMNRFYVSFLTVEIFILIKVISKVCFIVLNWFFFLEAKKAWTNYNKLFAVNQSLNAKTFIKVKYKTSVPINIVFITTCNF